MEIKFCFRHPQTIARWKCYYCKKPICKACRYPRSHHYFCSSTCYYRYLLQEGWTFFRKNQNAIQLGWLILLTLVVGLILLIPSSRPDETLTAPAEETTADWQYLRAHMPLWLNNHTSREVVREMIQNKTYTLRLPMEAGWTITIWRNNWPVLSQVIPLASTYQFPIPLQYGDNHIRAVIWDEFQNLIGDHSFSIRYQNPVVEALWRSVDRIPVQQHRLALTFDGGSSAEDADKILSILREKGIHTTVFLTGKFMERYPSLVRQIVADGHEVGNHTYSHPHLTTYSSNRRHQTRSGVTRQYVQRQLLKADSVFHRLTGQHMAPFWRAPYGEYNRDILLWAAEVGYMHIRWTPGFDTFDWITDQSSPLYKTPRQVLEKILRYRQTPQHLDGAILLMHLGNHRQTDPMYTILPGLIDSLNTMGFKILPVGQLIAP